MSAPEPENRLLTVLPFPSPCSEDFTLVWWKAREPLYGVGDAIENVYFPLDAVVSVVTETGDGAAIEAATIGREGMIGVEVLLQAPISNNRVFVQLPGRVLQVAAPRVLELAERHQGFGRLLYRHVLALMSQIARSAACTWAHPVDQRTARCLLMTHDRVGRDDFPLTQEFLAQMLGVGRPRVSTAAATLQRAELIRYTRGHMTVTDRRGLERASCDCYRSIADVYARLLG